MHRTPTRSSKQTDTEHESTGKQADRYLWPGALYNKVPRRLTIEQAQHHQNS